MQHTFPKYALATEASVWVGFLEEMEEVLYGVSSIATLYVQCLLFIEHEGLYKIVFHETEKGACMSKTAVRTLVLSSTSGRYALDDPVEGADLIGGTPIEIRLGGHWIAGTIEHGGGLNAVDGQVHGSRGYYFISSTGQLCGLCAGMKVRLR